MKFFAISLLGIYLISITELNQLVKLPLLVKHFIEHKEKDKQLSFFAFLDKHYATSEFDEVGHDEHSNLPFKSHHSCVTAFSLAFYSNNVTSLLFKPIQTQNSNFSIYKEKKIKSAYLSFIWQPPKHA